MCRRCLNLAFLLLLGAVNLDTVNSDEPLDPKRILRRGLQSGPDYRLPASSDKHPWRCVGKVVAGDGSYGTGTLVSDYLVLTNAHVVEDRSGELDWPIRFYPGYAEGPGKYVSRVATVWRGESETGRDYAILRLKSPLGDTIGHVGIAKRNLSTVAAPEWKNKLFMIGYSSDLRRGEIASHYIGCSIMGDADDAGWYHDCDALRGSSGSGLMFLSDTGVKIVALHWGGLDPAFDNELCVPVSAFWKRYKKAKQDEPYEYTTVHVINNSKRDSIWASVAYPRTSNGKTIWVSRGHFKVNQGESREIVIDGRKRYSGSLYWYAHGGGSKWAGDTQLAVDSPSAFRIDQCDSASNKRRYGSRGFRKKSIEYGKVNTIKLTSR